MDTYRIVEIIANIIGDAILISGIVESFKRLK
jgi:hypothetical protein